MEITTLGIDIAKSVFQLHGVDASAQTVLRKRLRRNQVLEFVSKLPRCLTATALAASIPDASVFRSGRHFAAFLGLVPRQNSTGGKDRLGRITKMDDPYLRTLLVNGATAVIRRIEKKTAVSTKHNPLVKMQILEIQNAQHVHVCAFHFAV